MRQESFIFAIPENLRLTDGQLAAEGCYVHGKEKGLWRFYDEQGNFEEEETYE